MGLKIAHFPTVKTLEDFDFKFQPSVDQRLVRELATSRFVTQAENVSCLNERSERPVDSHHWRHVGPDTIIHKRREDVATHDQVAVRVPFDTRYN